MQVKDYTERLKSCEHELQVGVFSPLKLVQKNNADTLPCCSWLQMSKEMNHLKKNANGKEQFPLLISVN